MKLKCNKTPVLADHGPAIKRYLKRVAEAREWQAYFAWLPVVVEENDCRWLETVERRCAGGEYWFESVGLREEDWDDSLREFSLSNPFERGSIFWSQKPAIEYRAKGTSDSNQDA